MTIQFFIRKVVEKLYIKFIIQTKLNFFLIELKYFIDEIRFSIIKDHQRILLVTDSISFSSEQQYNLILRHRKALRKNHKILITRVLLKRALKLKAYKLSKYNYIGLKLHFLKGEEKYLNTVKHFYEFKNKSTKLICFDGDDGMTILFPDSLSYFDLYFKKHIFSDKNNYLKKYLGGTSLTNYLVSSGFFDLSLLENQEALPVKEEFLNKIYYTWNIGLSDSIYDLILSNIEPKDKPIDIVCRATYRNKNDYREFFRKPAIDKINQLGKIYNVSASSKRISIVKYTKELLLAKICVSPYGYCQICWRDFEAILCGCLLIKPDMEHVNTWPNIYVENQTYVPVKKDFSNLEEVCKFYLNNTDERLRIARNAKEVLIESSKSESFVQRFADIL